MSIADGGILTIIFVRPFLTVPLTCFSFGFVFKGCNVQRFLKDYSTPIQIESAYFCSRYYYVS